MDVEDPDWKPCKVKLESELLDKNDEMDNSHNDSCPEASRQISLPLFLEHSPVASEKTGLNLMNSLLSDTLSASSTSHDVENKILKIKEEKTEDEHPDSSSEASHQVPFAVFLEQSSVVFENNDLNLMSTSSTSHDVPYIISQIKEEKTEDVDPLADSCSDDLHWSSPKMTQSASLENDSVFSQKVNSVKRELIDKEIHDITKEKSRQMEFMEVLEIKSEGLSCNIADFTSRTESKGNLSFKLFSSGDSIYQKTKDKIEDEGAKIYNLTFSPSRQCPDQSKFVPYSDNGCEIHSYTISSISGDISVKRMKNNTCKDHAVGASNENPFPTNQCSADSNSRPAVKEHILADCSTPGEKSSDLQCSAILKTNLSLKKDVLTYSDGTPSSSKQYPEQFQDKSNFRSSVGKQTSERYFSCNQCSARFSTNFSLKKHSLTHSDERPVSCDQCSAQFKWKSDLKKHSLTHSERPVSCDQCSARFKWKSDLKKHSLTHSDERPVSCDQCFARFKWKSDLKKHSLTHSDERPVSCDQCSARFKLRSDLKKHSLTHSDERPVSCDQCSARFKWKSDLKKHLVTHSDERAFSCNHCFARFKRKAHLQEHLRGHSDERIFSCNQCSARFNWKADLKKHLVTHLDEKSFSCSQCSARFKWKSDLKKHFVSHSDERAFSCSQCLAQFKRESDLKAHVVTHLFKKTFSCSKCSAEFKSKSLLEGHLLTHSNICTIFS